jgi:hypothetical protein
MVSRIALTLSLLGALLLLWAGCSGTEPCVKVPAYLAAQGILALGEACEQDADCQSRFCDRDRCNEPDQKYGSACAPLPPDPWPIERVNRCQGFVCLSDRCRSCTADAECQSEYGMGKCRPMGDDAPGWPERFVCRPAVELKQRNAACTDDKQCWSSFCDRGRCKWSNPSTSYGELCTKGPPKPPTRHPEAHAKGTCEGYLCVDGRCRSCLSDAECQEGSSDLKCLDFDNWNGQVCVTQRDAENEPAIIGGGPPPSNMTHEKPRSEKRVPPAPRSPSRCP